MSFALISVRWFDLPIPYWKFDDQQNERVVLQITLFGWDSAGFLILFNILVESSNFIWLFVFFFNRRHWRFSQRFESWEIPPKFRRRRGKFNIFLTTFTSFSLKTWISFWEIIRISSIRKLIRKTSFIPIIIWKPFWWLLLRKE